MFDIIEAFRKCFKMYFINFIELNKPAHLGYKIVYSYMTWDEFDRYNKTWDAWDSLNLNWNDREKYKE